MTRATNDTTNANAKASMPKMRIGKSPNSAAPAVNGRSRASPSAQIVAPIDNADNRWTALKEKFMIFLKQANG